MLSLVPPEAPDALEDSLAELAAVLHPRAGLGSPADVLGSARGTARRVLARLRHHLHETKLAASALAAAEPALAGPLQAMSREHQDLRRFTHDLCRRLRAGDGRGARGIAREFLATLLRHGARERRMIAEAVRRLDPAATSRFADALFRRLIRTRGGLPPSRESVAELHSLYVRLIHHLQSRPESPEPSELCHEHSGRG